MATRKPPKRKTETRRASLVSDLPAAPLRSSEPANGFDSWPPASDLTPSVPFGADPDAAPPSDPAASSEFYATFDAPLPLPDLAPSEGERAPEELRPPVDRASSPMSVDEVEAQIHKLENQLDRLIQKSQKKNAGPDGQPGRVARAIAERLKMSGDADPSTPEDGEPVDVTRELLSSDYYLRQWGRVAMRNRSEEVDDFGLDPKYAARWQPFFDFLYKRYFRVETVGASNIPSEGRCLLVANHSGTLPYDGAILKTAMLHAHPAKRDLRWLAEDFLFYLPFLGAFMNRIGAVRACQENAERLLNQGRLVCVFPEGVKGIGKLFRDRYRLQRFGRGGFIRLCLRTGTPLVPCAVIGAEEATPMLYRLEHLASVFGVPYLPVTPTFPALGPLGLIPAPTKWRIELGEPIRFDGYGPEAADDSLLVGRLSEKVRSTIQAMLDRGLSERQSVWFG